MGGASSGATSITLFQPNVSYDVVVTYENRVSGYGTLKIYVNGILEVSVETSIVFAAGTGDTLYR